MKSTKKIELPTPTLCDRPEPKNISGYHRLGRLRTRGTWHIKPRLPQGNIYASDQALEHMKKEHLNKPKDFVRAVSGSYGEIRLGSKRQGEQTFLLCLYWKEDGKHVSNIAIELIRCDNGKKKWYEVTTGFIRPVKEVKKRKLIWSSD